MYQANKSITIVCLEPLFPIEGAKVIDCCSDLFKFDRRLLISTAKPEEYSGDFHPVERLTWHGYNDYILGLGKLVNTDYCLIVQTDGYIVNPQLWDDAWLEYDYVGAPWPHQQSWIERQFPQMQKFYNANTRVGNGGFSLRSRKFLECSNLYDTCQGVGEDQFLCCEKYQDMIKAGIKFAPPEIAIKFSVENPVIELGIEDWMDVRHPNFNKTKSFGFHGRNFQ